MEPERAETYRARALVSASLTKTLFRRRRRRCSTQKAPKCALVEATATRLAPNKTTGDDWTRLVVPIRHWANFRSSGGWNYCFWRGLCRAFCRAVPYRAVPYRPPTSVHSHQRSSTAVLKPSHCFATTRSQQQPKCRKCRTRTRRIKGGNWWRDGACKRQRPESCGRLVSRCGSCRIPTFQHITHS